ncbi:MAG: methionine adenosyltransferase [Muribaculaceae bacterium]|nr:methionine adenosyltransferase [Muribaculaceae bacterium]
MNYLFTSESVSEGHPDKVADQISDAVLDAFLAQDPDSKVACETMVTTGQVVIAGEVRSKAYIDLMTVARKVITDIGYDRSELMFDGHSCGIFTALHEQSPDINRGVVRENPEDQGAGDQGMMFGYACNETDDYIPLTVALSHELLKELATIRRDMSAMTYVDAYGHKKSYLRPDSKSQVTVEYDSDNRPVAINTIVVSTQHEDFIQPDGNKTQEEADREMLDIIKRDIANVLIPRVKAKMPDSIKKLWGDDIILHVNPTGKFVIGGPHGDTGLTGRKIIVDTYGGHGAHGGGAFSGKDPSKVDRSAAYAARHIAKNLVAAGVADKALVQVAYAIGVAAPVSLFVNTMGTAHVDMTDAEISAVVSKLFDMRPAEIEKRLKLRNPIYLETATYGHVGRKPCKVVKEFLTDDGNTKKVEVELFTWEKTDMVNKVKEAFSLV